uniref:Secreted peptide n=1 Tax=Anopheles braziliensis TaxID=58242 RepID=A0A2M3ZLN7_9DIPT
MLPSLCSGCTIRAALVSRFACLFLLVELATVEGDVGHDHPPVGQVATEQRGRCSVRSGGCCPLCGLLGLFASKWDPHGA